MTAEVQYGAGAVLGPAATSAFHALLDKMLGRSFDRAGADGQVLVAKAWVLHAMRVAAEVAALALEDGGRLGRARLYGIEPLQRRRCSARPETVESRGGPGFRLGRVFTAQRFGNRPEVFGRMEPVDNLGALAPEQRGHMLPDPLRAVAQHDYWP